MLGLESLGATGQAAGRVAIVFASSLALYVVYGALTMAASDRLERVLQG